MLKDGEKGVIRQRRKDKETYAIAPHFPCGMALPSKMKMGVSGCKIQCAENCIKDISKRERVGRMVDRIGLDTIKSDLKIN